MRKLLVICGATATGKSALAVDCAKILQTDVISADSQLVYRGLDVGTAKPDAEEMKGVRHHMIDIVGADENFSVSDYERLALPKINGLLDEGKTPVICGGTGFYIYSLLYKFGYGNAKGNEEVRAKYEAILNEKGKTYLHSLLEEVDRKSAEILHENDVKRVIRALEIYETSGKRKSDQNDSQEPRFDYLAFAIDYPREQLYERIDKRVDAMFEAGLVEEVRSLLNIGIDENSQCMQAIGYKEVVAGLKNGDNDSTMRDIIKLNTRHYAKRQLTFFKKMRNLVWLKPDQAYADYVIKLFNETV